MQISLSELAADAIGTGVARLTTNDGPARAGTDPEAVHQARVATRRLRSDLKTLEPLLDPVFVVSVRGDLRWVGDLLGTVRDADVLLAGMEEVGQRLHLPAGSTKAIAKEIAHDRWRSHDALVHALTAPRYTGLVGRLEAAAGTPPFAEGVDGGAAAGPAVRPLVRQAWRRLARAVDRLGEVPSDGDLHEIRKRAKRARYAAELVAATFDHDATELAERLEDLQDVLGMSQDAVVAEARLGSLAREGRVAGEVAFTAGRVAASLVEQGMRAREQWPAAWEAARAKRLRRWLR